MDYRSCLENAFKPGLMVNTKFKLRQLFSRFYTYEDTKESEAKRGLYLHVMAGGNVETDFPYSARLLLASAAIVIRCRKGGVRISGSKKNWQITAGNLFICPCTDNLSIHSLLLPCEYQIFVVGGSELSLYQKLISDGLLLACEDNPALGVYLDRLGKIPETIDDNSFLIMHEALCDLLTSACTDRAESSLRPCKTVPFYLEEMHDFITDHPEKSFSLLAFERQFHISRYRLCREYSASYGIPPLQDFNRRRIEQAKNLLLTTDLQVQEVGARCGFENVNHFINLFRKNTGMTPGVFRKTVHADLV